MNEFKVIKLSFVHNQYRLGDCHNKNGCAFWILILAQLIEVHICFVKLQASFVPIKVKQTWISCYFIGENSTLWMKGLFLFETPCEIMEQRELFWPFVPSFLQQYFSLPRITWPWEIKSAVQRASVIKPQLTHDYKPVITLQQMKTTFFHGSPGATGTTTWWAKTF